MLLDLPRSTQARRRLQASQRGRHILGHRGPVNRPPLDRFNPSRYLRMVDHDFEHVVAWLAQQLFESKFQ